MTRKQFLNLSRREQHLHIDGLLTTNGKRLNLGWTDATGADQFQEALKRVLHLVDADTRAIFIPYKGFGYLKIMTAEMHQHNSFSCTAGQVGLVGLLRAVICNAFTLDLNRRAQPLEDHIELIDR